jgi:hypothetical protein
MESFKFLYETVYKKNPGKLLHACPIVKNLRARNSGNMRVTTMNRELDV